MKQRQKPVPVHLGNQHYAQVTETGMIQVFTERGRVFLERDTLKELCRFAESVWNMKITVEEAKPQEEGKKDGYV